MNGVDLERARMNIALLIPQADKFSERVIDLNLNDQCISELGAFVLDLNLWTLTEYLTTLLPSCYLCMLWVVIWFTEWVGPRELIYIPWFQLLSVLEPSQLWCRVADHFTLKRYQAFIRQDGLKALQELRLFVVLWICNLVQKVIRLKRYKNIGYPDLNVTKTYTVLF